MKKLIAVLLVPALAGCLTVTMPEVSQWNVEYAGAVRPAQKTAYDVVRVTQVMVRSPYNAAGLAVLRADGSVALDPYNEYAALPSSLLKGVVFEALDASGLCRTAVNASSSAVSSASLEVMVTKLALDCRKAGVRRAVADVLVRVIGKDEVRVARGDGAADAADGNYGAALSRAVSAALDAAFAQMRP